MIAKHYVSSPLLLSMYFGCISSLILVSMNVLLWTSFSTTQHRGLLLACSVCLSGYALVKLQSIYNGFCASSRMRHCKPSIYLNDVNQLTVIINDLCKLNDKAILSTVSEEDLQQFLQKLCPTLSVKTLVEVIHKIDSEPKYQTDNTVDIQAISDASITEHTHLHQTIPAGTPTIQKKVSLQDNGNSLHIPAFLNTQTAYLLNPLTSKTPRQTRWSRLHGILSNSKYHKNHHKNNHSYFSQSDADMLNHFVQLAQIPLLNADIKHIEEQQVRKAISRDLHDDISARILTLLQFSYSSPLSQRRLVQDSLIELRTLLQQLDIDRIELTDAVSQWRHQISGQLNNGNSQLTWLVKVDSEKTIQLTSQQFADIRRILRDAIETVKQISEKVGVHVDMHIHIELISNHILKLSITHRGIAINTLHQKYANTNHLNKIIKYAKNMTGYVNWQEGKDFLQMNVLLNFISVNMIAE